MTTSTDYGPLEMLLRDPTVMEILVDGPDKIYVERHGQLEDVADHFRDEAHLMEIIQQIAAQMGHRVNASDPIADLRMANGSRVNIVVPPIAITGPTMVIRKLPERQMTVEDLIGYGT